MSSVRGCDDCGIIFFENAEGWGTGVVAKMVKGESGRITPKEIQVDYCPECVTKRETGAAAAKESRNLVTSTERKQINGKVEE
jgi:hypothetical protein